MEPYEEFLIQSQRQYEVAIHLLTETYPFVKDPKMLPAILERLYYAIDHTITALLRFERNHKRIPAYNDDFDEKWALVKKIATKYKLKLKGLDEIRTLWVKEKEASLVFARKESLVLVHSKIHTLNAAKLKDLSSKTKVFIEAIRNGLRTEVIQEAGIQR